MGRSVLDAEPEFLGLVRTAWSRQDRVANAVEAWAASRSKLVEKPSFNAVVGQTDRDGSAFGEPDGVCGVNDGVGGRSGLRNGIINQGGVLCVVPRVSELHQNAIPDLMKPQVHHSSTSVLRSCGGCGLMNIVSVS